MENRKPLIVRITAVTSMFTLMGLLVAFKSGALDSFVTEKSENLPPDSIRKKDTLISKEHIVIVDSSFYYPEYIYSSKAMVMDNGLKFDTVYRDTIQVGTKRANEIISTYYKMDKAKTDSNDSPDKKKTFMGSSKSDRVFELPESPDSSKNKK